MARFKIFALTTAGAAAAACSPIQQTLPPPNMALTSVNQPVVQRTDYVLDLSAGGNGTGPSELRRLDDWFQSLRLGYGDRIFIDAPYVDANSRRDIADVAGRYGMLLSDGAPVTAGTVQPGSVRVIVSRTTASVPGCPNWDELRVNASGATSSNYGCAVNSNLAAMIANPNDLVRGQAGSGASDAATVAKAVKLYRDAVPTGGKPLQSETAGGK